jgi:hypothetical protein
MNVNYHILNESIIVNYGGKVIKIPRETKRAEQVLDLIRENRLEEIPMLIDIELKIRSYSKEKFIIENGVVFSYGQPVHPVITNKILQFYASNIPFDYLLNLWNNIKENPSEEAQQYIYGFLEAGEFAITPDGYIIAYKRINKNFTDVYTGTLDNSVGKVVSMDRSQVCADRDRTCAPGLHIAAFDYAKYHYHGGDPNTLLIELKVHPKDIVMIPIDYDNQKCRCCEYLVIDVIDQQHTVFVLDDDKYVSDEFKESNEKVAIDPLANDSLTCDAVNECATTNTKYHKTIKIGNDMYEASPIEGDVNERIRLGAYVRRKPSKIPASIANAYNGLDLECSNLYAREDIISGRVYLATYVTSDTKQQKAVVAFRKKK